MAKGFCVREYVSKERPTKIKVALCDPGNAEWRIYLSLSCDKAGTFYVVTEGMNIDVPCADPLSTSMGSCHTEKAKAEWQFGASNTSFSSKGDRCNTTFFPADGGASPLFKKTTAFVPLHSPPQKKMIIKNQDQRFGSALTQYRKCVITSRQHLAPSA